MWIFCGNAKEFSNAVRNLGKRFLFFFIALWPGISSAGDREFWQVKHLVL
jgi:hypothetical protein